METSLGNRHRWATAPLLLAAIAAGTGLLLAMRASPPAPPLPEPAVAALAQNPAPEARPAFDVELLRRAQAPPNGLWLEEVALGVMEQDWGEPQAGKTVDRNPLRLKDVVYPHGVGTHAISNLRLDLKGAATRFLAMVGLDDERTGQGSITFEVWVDGKKVFSTPALHGGDAPVPVDVDLTGARKLHLQVGDAGDGITNDHADWAGALLLLKPGATEKPGPEAAGPPPPISVDESPQPRINHPRVVGATPGRPFLFRIPATGQPPLRFSSKGLPAGLVLDTATGIIAGSIQAEGTYRVQVTVKGPAGSARGELTLIAGRHKLAQTPPLGWNSWNVWAGQVNAQRVRDAADWLVKSGLAAHGYSYICIDDTWEGQRDQNGELQTNEKFGDMNALADYVHGKGLKLGIYSSPGRLTCAGFTGSLGHEAQDARTWAKWGVDYLKYDWCSYEETAKDKSREELMKPYRIMGDALDAVNRDIIYSLCQYGMGNVWEWGGQVNGNLWRTTGDITDTWSSMAGIGFSQNGHEAHAGPGRWNDPDMLAVGRVGWGNPHPTRLRPNEQLTHITLWSLLAAPMIIGCDLTRLDPFTLALLTNDEVLAVDQDPLGKAAKRVAKSGDAEVWARPLSDGTTAVGLFNRSWEPLKVTARWADLGLGGKQPVRDLWLRKDHGRADGQLTEQIPPHGAALFKIGTPRR
jgi:alpha-galactosidase